MLDQQTQDLEDTVAAEDGQDTVEAAGEDTIAAEEPEIVIAIEGEEPEAEPDAEIEAELGEAGKRALKAAREAQKETARKLREAEAERDALKAANKPAEAKEEDDIGPEPTSEDCGFNDAVFRQKTIEWNDKKRKLDERKAKEKDRAKADADAYNAKLARYNEERIKMGVDDDAQARVIAKLNPAQQTALMKYATDPTKLVAGLVRAPKMLAELSSITDIGAFIYQLPAAEGKITVTTKAPPPPESRVRGGVATPAGSFQAQLAAAEKNAERTGDRTEVIRIRRAMRDAGVAS